MIPVIENKIFIEREKLFRKFQIEKFKRNRSVPCVSMTIDICVEKLLEERLIYNNSIKKEDKITLTHVLIKAVSKALKQFPDLYGYFDGEKVISSEIIKINLPVAEGNHVEYVVLENPNTKSLKEISDEVKFEVENISNDRGTFYLSLKKLFMLPAFVRSIVTSIPSVCIKSAYKSYGNFPITNFGSFGIKNGVPIISSPMIGLLCLGAIQKTSDELTICNILPVTLVFDHRPIDGAYGGKFLNCLKELIENRTHELFYQDQEIRATSIGRN